MRLQRKDRPPGDIDVTSFSDLAFLLIVFFVLTTTFIRPEGAQLTIPSSTLDPARKSEQEPPTINLAADRLLLNETEMSIEELRGELLRMKLGEREENRRFVIVESAPDVPFQRYYRVVTAISKAGGVLALVETQEEEPPGEQGAAE